MPPLIRDMKHEQMAAHLREEVCNTARYETERLIDFHKPGFFGAVRAIMSDLDYVAALYQGWDGRNRREISTARKTIEFLRDVFPDATGESGYAAFSEHLYQMYRVGTVHLRAPKRVSNPRSATAELGWALMYERQENAEYAGTSLILTHLRLVQATSQRTLLPVSIRVFFDDFLSSCDEFARRIEQEHASGGTVLRDRWRSAANALVEAEPSDLLW